MVSSIPSYRSTQSSSPYSVSFHLLSRFHSSRCPEALVMAYCCSMSSAPQLPKQDTFRRIQWIQTVTIVWMAIEAAVSNVCCMDSPQLPHKCDRFAPPRGPGDSQRNNAPNRPAATCKPPLRGEEITSQGRSKGFMRDDGSPAISISDTTIVVRCRASCESIE